MKDRLLETDIGQQIAKLALRAAQERGTNVPALLAELVQDIHEMPAGQVTYLLHGVKDAD